MAHQQKLNPMDQNKDGVITPEEANAEQETLAHANAKEDEVRASIIAEYEFDETADADRISKLVAKDMENRKKLSDAIGQKIKHRNDAKKFADELKNKGGVTPPAPVVADKKVDVSLKDNMALIKADVHEDDIDEVLDYAKFKGISVSEALKSPAIKATLEGKAELRNVAAGTNTGPSRHSSAKISDEALLANAEAGKLPETDEDITRLMRIKSGRK